jgi:hypothetical protein
MIGLKEKPFIALDFDGTCVRHDYPRIGGSIGAREWLLKWTAAGAQLILWTMRDGAELGDAKAWFAARGIELAGVQFNPGQSRWTSSPKAYAKLYLDDHGYGVPLIHPGDGSRPFVNWDVVGPEVLAMLSGES